MTRDEADQGESRRQIARRQTKRAGDRSARVAHTLMEVPEHALGRLGLDAELRALIDKARKVTSNIARRREERSLAGALRRVDLIELQQRLDDVQQTGRADVRIFQQAEAWRTKLIEGGAPAVEAFTALHAAAGEPAFARLVASARREHTTGKPPGGARALFRAMMAIMAPPIVALASGSSADDDPADDD